MAANIKITNEKGTVEVSANIVNDIIKNAVYQLDGKAFLSTPRGKLVKKGTNAENAAVDYNFKGDRLYIKVYIVIRFGAGINATTRKLMKIISNDIKDSLGIEPAQVSIMLRGIISKRLVKRNIEINSSENADF